MMALSSHLSLSLATPARGILPSKIKEDIPNLNECNLETPFQTHPEVCLLSDSESCEVGHQS